MEITRRSPLELTIVSKLNADLIVIGGGIIGMTTAYEATRRGLATLLIEAREGVGLETSFANGALLHPSSTEPWNAPGVHRHLLASLFDPSSAMKLRLHAIPSLLTWGPQFLYHSNRRHHERATRANFLLAQYSVSRTRQVREELGLHYRHASTGTIKLFRDHASLQAGAAAAHKLEALGLRFEMLDPARVVTVEPSLGAVESDLAGGLRFRGDETGDAFAFCQCLQQEFARLGGRIVTQAKVEKIAYQSERHAIVRTTGGDFQTRSVVVAAGGQSNKILKGLGPSLPIRPAKGYTATYSDVPPGGPAIPVIDDTFHCALVPLGKDLRIAGTAEFTGNDTRIAGDRVANLRRLLKQFFPQLAESLADTEPRAWAGLRPMSADGMPFIGRVGTRNLFVNAGHGHLGWTSAMGSAAIVVDAILEEPSAVDASPFRPER